MFSRLDKLLQPASPQRPGQALHAKQAEAVADAFREASGRRGWPVSSPRGCADEGRASFATDRCVPQRILRHARSMLSPKPG